MKYTVFSALIFLAVTCLMASSVQADDCVDKCTKSGKEDIMPCLKANNNDLQKCYPEALVRGKKCVDDCKKGTVDN